jgi:Xaa-Pro aminopeptidase
MLDASELAWLNAYHKRVMNEVEPHLDVKTRDWLATACREIT